MGDNIKKVEEIVKKVFNLTSSRVLNISFLGGMTNKNYLVSFEDKDYSLVVRLPGAMTENFINRDHEAVNSLIMSQKGFNVQTCFFDAKSGVKITKYLQNSEALDHKTIRDLSNLKQIALKVKELHSENIELKGKFQVFCEFDKYINLLKNKQLFYEYSVIMPQLINFFENVKKYLSESSVVSVACHNDLVPENILLKDEKVYFIDWEYSGMNDPMFDIAALFVEARLDKEEEKFFLQHYFDKLDYKEEVKRIALYKFVQDVLWFVWTLVKEENNEFFGDYGEMRIQRAILFMKNCEYKEFFCEI